MVTLLYVETNFSMSYATGRDAPTARLVLTPSAEIQLVTPSCSFMEALCTLEDEQKRHNRLLASFDSQIRQAERNVISSHARLLASHLQRSVIESSATFDDFQSRLFEVIEILSTRADLIELSPALIQRSLRDQLIRDPTDNLILTAILDHAGQHGSERKAFLTENRKCFHDNLDARLALQQAGIKYFAVASKFLQWLGAKPEV